MELGASGFLPKSAPFTAISEAVRAVLAGDLWFPDAASGAADAFDAQLAARVAELTPQQHRVLVMLAQGKPNKEIAYELDVHEGTVKAHVTQILQKLGVHSRTQAALVAERFAGGTITGTTSAEPRSVGARDARQKSGLQCCPPAVEHGEDA